MSIYYAYDHMIRITNVLTHTHTHTHTHKHTHTHTHTHTQAQIYKHKEKKAPIQTLTSPRSTQILISRMSQS